MQNWLTIELVFGLLLVTSFTFVGLLALWAATNPRLWWLRSIFVLVLLLALEEIPAYELWALFSLQACVIIMGARMWRWFVSRGRSDASPTGKETESGRGLPFQFSLRTLLVVPLFAAVLLPCIRIPESVSDETLALILTFGIDGVCGGCAVLLGAWIFAARRKWIVWPVALAVTAAVACFPAWLDWLFACVTSWPRWPPYAPTPWVYRKDPFVPYPALAWFVILPAVTIATWLAIRLWMAGWNAVPDAGNVPGPPSRKRLACRAVFILLLLTVAFPPVALTWRLLHPPAMPILPAPQPNGADAIFAAGRDFGWSHVLDRLSVPCTTDELAAEVAEHADAYELLRQGLSQGIQLRDWTKRPTTDTNEPGPQRALEFHVSSPAYALAREAELARRQGRYDDAARSAVECLQLAQAITLNGIVDDCESSLEMEAAGNRAVYEMLPYLNADQCRKTLAVLAEIDASREPVRDVICRDRIWHENTGKWFRQLVTLLDAVACLDWDYKPLAILKRETVTRLLILELAMRAYSLEQGAPPQQLDQLTPEILPELPRDPFDPQGGPFRYARTDKGVVVYSVGPDGCDDGGLGISPRPDRLDPESVGDLRLDVVFPPKPSEEDSKAGDGASKE